MNSSRFRNLVGSRRRSNTPQGQGASSSTTTLDSSPQPGQQTPASQANSSQTSIPMNPPPPNQLGRPPSYPNYPPPHAANLGAPPQHGRPASPLPPPIQTQGQVPHPPYPQQGQMYGAPPPSGPPSYTPSQQPSGYGYGAYNRPAEVEGAGRSRAQLIVGIDFVRLSCRGRDTRER